MLLRLIINQIQDRLVQDNLQRLQNFFDAETLLNGQFKFFESTFIKDETLEFAHGLKFTPADIIQTSIKGTGSIVFNYDNFDSENISVTVSGTSASDPLVVRYLVGRLS